jgi:hypothetical protein
VDEARVAYVSALSATDDRPAAASPTQCWLHARATLGLARLAEPTDVAQALRLARDARELLGATGHSVRERKLIDEARAIEAKARAG